MFTFSNNYIFFHWQYMNFKNKNTVFTLQTNGSDERIHNKKNEFFVWQNRKKTFIPSKNTFSNSKKRISIGENINVHVYKKQNSEFVWIWKMGKGDQWTVLYTCPLRAFFFN